LEETAVAHAERALPRAAFRRLGLPKKELLGGCCVLASCRQHGWPLTMGTLCSLLYADAELLAGVYRGLRAELQLCVPALGLAELVKTHLNSFRLFQQAADVPAPFVEDKEQMVTRTLQVVELAGDTWLVTGRHPVPVVTAAAFLAWQSLRPAARLACTLARFCRAAGVEVPPPAPLRLKELHDVLLRMAAQLAWLRVLHLDKKTVVKHLGDILQHRVFLLRKAFRAEEEDEEEEEEEEEQVAAAAPGAAGPEKHQVSRLARTEAPGRLLPPCLLRPRKRPRAAAPSAPAPAVTGDEPISDSEIEQYLRGREEARAFGKAKAWL
ncbi:BRF2 factor, partial [Nothoprocta ornata]|nr:BRF2 factor [Nothoprocta ornata]